MGALGTSANNLPIVPAPGNYEVGKFGGMMIEGGNRSTLRKPTSVPFFSTTNPTCSDRKRTRAAGVGSQRITA
jgi:hypothetical protein